MAKLVLSTEGAIVWQGFIDRERLGIGRDSDNAIAIDDPAVSRRHAAIVPVGNDHIVDDLDSANGTIVNGAPASRRILQHGDVMTFGAHSLRYLNPKAASEIDLERTMLIPGLARSAGDASGANAAALIATTARKPRSSFPTGRVIMLEGRRAGETIALDRVVMLAGDAGRGSAVITRRPQGYFVTHVEGRRHPRVNGRAIGHETRPLQSGDVVQVGEDVFRFESP